MPPDYAHEYPLLTFDPEAGPDAVLMNLNELLTTRLLIQANSGGGKSWAIRYLLEQTHGHIQHLVIDLEGEFASLREQFPYVLAGQGPGCDVVLSATNAADLTCRLVELQASAIFDLSEITTEERAPLVHEVMTALLNLPRAAWRPLLIMIDEAHVFCPEREKTPAKAAIIDACSRGRKRGHIMVLATQRLAKLAKSAAAELKNALIGQTILELDLKRIGDDRGLEREDQIRLKHLEPGTFYATGPAILYQGKKTLGNPVVVRTGPVQTTHPETGMVSPPAPPPPAAIKELLEQLQDLKSGDEQAAWDTSVAQERIAALEGQLRELREQPVSPRIIQAAVTQATIPLEARIEALTARLRQAQAVIGSLATFLNADPAEDLQDLPLATDAVEPRISSTAETVVPVLAPVVQPEMHQRPSPAPAVPSLTAAPAGGDLSAPQQRILAALGAFHACGLSAVDRSNVAVWSKQSPTSGGFQNNLGRLRALGLLEYPSKGQVALTDAGKSFISPVAMPVSLQELHERWYAVLSGPQTRILQALIKAYPEPIQRDKLAEETGQSSTSGGYQNNLGHLRSLGLVDYPQAKWVVATALLFPRALLQALSVV